ncbi:MAG: hypothetical protein ACAI38_12235 [Myxococcota bacterium]
MALTSTGLTLAKLRNLVGAHAGEVAPPDAKVRARDVDVLMRTGKVPAGCPPDEAAALRHLAVEHAARLFGITIDLHSGDAAQRLDAFIVKLHDADAGLRVDTATRLEDLQGIHPLVAERNVTEGYLLHIKSGNFAGAARIEKTFTAIFEPSADLVEPAIKHWLESSSGSSLVVGDLADLFRRELVGVTTYQDALQRMYLFAIARRAPKQTLSDIAAELTALPGPELVARAEVGAIRAMALKGMATVAAVDEVIGAIGRRADTLGPVGCRELFVQLARNQLVASNADLFEHIERLAARSLGPEAAAFQRSVNEAIDDIAKALEAKLAGNTKHPRLRDATFYEDDVRQLALLAKLPRAAAAPIDDLLGHLLERVKGARVPEGRDPGVKGRIIADAQAMRTRRSGTVDGQ